MEINFLIDQLEQNASVFEALLKEVPEVLSSWKPSAHQWSMLEVICHLYDEEREDFRTRVSSVLDDPTQPFLSINPVQWVQERKYGQQSFAERRKQFLQERRKSVDWLCSLENPRWDNSYQHPHFGAMSAHFFLCNWLAHDYLHIRQITRLKYDYLARLTKVPIAYAGEWK